MQNANKIFFSPVKNKRPSHGGPFLPSFAKLFSSFGMGAIFDGDGLSSDGDRLNFPTCKYELPHISDWNLD